MFTPTLKFGAKTIGSDLAVVSMNFRCAAECPVVPITRGVLFRRHASQTSLVVSTELKSTTTSPAAIAPASESPRSHLPAIVRSGSPLATAQIAFPIRPSAPINEIRNAFIQWNRQRCSSGLPWQQEYQPVRSNAAIAWRKRFSFASLISQRGKRHSPDISPRQESAVFAGTGFGSMNNALKTGNNLR